MLTQVAPGVLTHTSEFCQSNAVVVQGNDGVLLIDPGIQESELACLAADVRHLGVPVIAGFSTHPHWDHLLWHAGFGEVPRYITAPGMAVVRARLSDEGARARVATMLPPEYADSIPLDLLGQVTELDGTEIPWDGPTVRVIEHSAHVPGHGSLLIEERRVLIAGDMLSDVLVPMLNLMGAEDPVADYLHGLELLEGLADRVDVLIPGHGAVGSAVLPRVELDRAYVQALPAGGGEDVRLSAPKPGWEWVREVHDRQSIALAG